jgi:hypothetical protein
LKSLGDLARVACSRKLGFLRLLDEFSNREDERTGLEARQSILGRAREL